MSEPLKFVPPEGVIVGWDFSTGSLKCLAFGMDGQTVAQVRFPTDLWHGEPASDAVCELSLMQLEGQARASVRGIASELKAAGRLTDWIAGGISATHHTAGRIDRAHNQVRRAICWNDQTLAAYRIRGERRLGGAKRVRELLGGPWADRYTLSHLVKDEDPAYFSPADWQRTYRILPHGALAAGYLTGHFDVISVSAAASTGIMDLRNGAWCPGMLGGAGVRGAPRPGPLAVAADCRPFRPDRTVGRAPGSGSRTRSGASPARLSDIGRPTGGTGRGGSGRQRANGGDPGQFGRRQFVIERLTASESLAGGQSARCDAVELGTVSVDAVLQQGAQFLDRVLGPKVDWKTLEQRGRRIRPGCDGVSVMPFIVPEPSLKVGASPKLLWSPREPQDRGLRFRAALEALAFLIARGVEEHEKAGQTIARITVSGGIARSDLMCEILASVLDRPLERLESDEGPALGAAVTALAAVETHLRRRNGVDTPYTVADAVAQLVRFRTRVEPNRAWVEHYHQQRLEFDARLVRQQSTNGAVSHTKSHRPVRKTSSSRKTPAARRSVAKRRR